MFVVVVQNRCRKSFFPASRVLSVIEGWLDKRGTMGGDDYHARLGSLLDEADRAEDAADERALAEDAPGSRSTSPVLERRSDALKGFTVGAKVRHTVYTVDALVIQLAAAGDFLNKEKVRIEWEKVEKAPRSTTRSARTTTPSPRVCSIGGKSTAASFRRGPRQRGSSSPSRPTRRRPSASSPCSRPCRRSGDYRAGGLHPDCHHAPLQQAQNWLSSVARGPLVIGPWCVRVRVETVD